MSLPPSDTMNATTSPFCPPASCPAPPKGRTPPLSSESRESRAFGALLGQHPGAAVVLDVRDQSWLSGEHDDFEVSLCAGHRALWRWVAWRSLEVAGAGREAGRGGPLLCHSTDHRGAARTHHCGGPQAGEQLAALLGQAQALGRRLELRFSVTTGSNTRTATQLAAMLESTEAALAGTPVRLAGGECFLRVLAGACADPPVWQRLVRWMRGGVVVGAPPLSGTSTPAFVAAWRQVCTSHPHPPRLSLCAWTVVGAASPCAAFVTRGLRWALALTEETCRWSLAASLGEQPPEVVRLELDGLVARRPVGGAWAPWLLRLAAAPAVRLEVLVRRDGPCVAHGGRLDPAAVATLALLRPQRVAFELEHAADQEPRGWARQAAADAARVWPPGDVPGLVVCHSLVGVWMGRDGRLVPTAEVHLQWHAAFSVAALWGSDLGAPGALR